MEINEKRAQIYWWFSSLYAKELTDEQLDAYRDKKNILFLEDLKAIEPLKDKASDFLKQLSRMLKRKDARLELAADYASCFLLSSEASALPYASFYVEKDQLLGGNHDQKIRVILDKFSIQIDQNYNEPTDHIAILLDLMGNFTIWQDQGHSHFSNTDWAAEQKNLLSDHIMNWLPQFANRLDEIDKFGFYRSLTHLLLAYIQLDFDALMASNTQKS